MSRAYYNEIDPYAAQWLRNLISAGHIAPGDVDERSIVDVRPDNLVGYSQCHFFAGIGVWSAALRRAGVSDSANVWTGSCPCQPFSAAGKGGGFDDERHLWPAFDWLIGQRRPDLVLGEQVEGPAGRKWLDLVATDLEGHGYAFGTAVFPAAGVGAPQIRHRTYWMADANSSGRERRRSGMESDGRSPPRFELERLCNASRLADSDDARLEGRAGVSERADQRIAWPSSLASRLASADEGQRGRLTSGSGSEPDRQAGGWQQGDGGASGDREAGGVAGSTISQPRVTGDAGGEGEARLQRGAGHDDCRAFGRPGPVNGFWRSSDWLYCRDDKWRPVESGTFPLAHGAPSRVGRLRAYGNAVCLEAATAFVSASMASLAEQYEDERLAA